MKVCANFEELMKHIYFDIMKDDYDRRLVINYGGQGEMLIFVFENEIPIRVRFQDVFTDDGVKNMLTAEVYAELLRTDIGVGWLEELDEICNTLQYNERIFRFLLEEGVKQAND